MCWLRRFLWLGCVAVTLASVVRAEEDSPVPPWGQDLEEKHPVTQKIDELESSHGQHGEMVPRFWVRADYLVWHIRSGRLPPLLTEGEPNVDRPGALLQPGTQPIYANEVDFEDRHGVRVTLGYAFGSDCGWALEGNYLFLDGRTAGTHQGSPGTPVLARPFFDAIKEREDASLIAYPGVVQGIISFENTSEMQGMELNLQRTMLRYERGQVEWFAGLRWLELDEELAIRERSRSVTEDPKDPLFNTSFSVGDEFHTDNDFFGVQIGLRAETRWKRLRFALKPQVALGAIRESVWIRGRTIIDANGAVTDVNTGLLALARNRGRHSRTEFAVVPEIAASIGLEITERLTFVAGYAFLYVSDVTRPGEQIDRSLNPNLIPTSATFGAPGGPARPHFRFNGNDFTAHGLNLALEWKF